MNKKIMTACIAGLFGGMSMVTATVQAASDIRVVGLFKDAAILNIDDQRKMLRVGSSHKNVRLIAANSEKATLEYKGKRIELAMSESAPIRTDYPVGHVSAHLISHGGTYNVTGSIDGRPAEFIVDTGATYVTMGADKARNLGLDFSHARRVMTNTANGKAPAHVLTLKSVMVGGIKLQNVEAAVVFNMPDDRILLGMSYLSKVEMQQNNGMMTLKYRGQQPVEKKAPAQNVSASSTAGTIAKNTL